ncbi:hypothetical protein BD324DRAFT_638819 [Kockovaella imperatae]|uniref:Uncharacterized protein n=1 Tax=Kockovaella imperatae TaxID=4999 RepID=A0A1Y1U8K9_9TREE|nr:hypothetical protein BD324DRAFT_638819 [Kockovaella imperatae]ORX33836.1 hypothetical protein BD324DRAFT_638819 [Kockovaella imperatae]
MSSAITMRSVAGPSRLAFTAPLRHLSTGPRSTGSNEPKPPASPPAWKPKRHGGRQHAPDHTAINSKRARRDVLARLVSLHHTAASFMHQAKDISTGFDNAFRYIEAEPYFLPFSRWKRGVLEHIADGPKVKERPVREDLPPLGRELEQRETLQPAFSHWRTFQPIESSWIHSKREIKGLAKSEREKQVKEAFFGVWDRGGVGMEDSQPSLEGIEEWIEARGSTVKEVADEWRANRTKHVAVVKR